MDPRNNPGPVAKLAPQADPFETSLTTLDARLTALKAVQEARAQLQDTRDREARAVGRAMAAVEAAEAAAAKLGAYDMLPPNLRPAVQAIRKAGGAL